MTTEKPPYEFSHVGVMPDVSKVDWLVENVTDIAVHIDGARTVIGIYVNPDCPALGCLDHWVGRRFDTFLTQESRIKFEDRLAEGEGSSRMGAAIELNHTDNAAWEYPIRYVPLPVSDGETVLLLGRDLRPIAEIQQRLVHEQLARERDQQKIRGAETTYRVVLEASETPLIVVDPESGRIRDINTAATTLLGAKPDTLGGNALNQAFEGVRRSELMDALEQAGAADEERSVQLTARRNGKPISIYPSYFRAAGALGILCRLAPFGDAAPSGGEMAQMLNALFTASTDAIAILDSKGFLRDANESFLVLADAAQLRDVIGKSFANFLVRGEVDLRLLLEGAQRDGRVRSYTAQFKSRAGTRAQIDISMALLGKSPGGEPGFGIIIRDVTQSNIPVENLSQSVVSEDALQNVMDLVGTATLKELVAATSDVIERMCISTALEITKNNRVAAADMLGLSRQSLYVKLRKYDMLKGDSGE